MRLEDDPRLSSNSSPALWMHRPLPDCAAPFLILRFPGPPQISSSNAKTPKGASESRRHGIMSLAMTGCCTQSILSLNPPAYLVGGIYLSPSVLLRTSYKSNKLRPGITRVSARIVEIVLGAITQKEKKTQGATQGARSKEQGAKRGSPNYLGTIHRYLSLLLFHSLGTS
jgi:hypothetical protein